MNFNRYPLAHESAESSISETDQTARRSLRFAVRAAVFWFDDV